MTENIFKIGEHVRIQGHWEFPGGITGTIAMPTPFQIDLAKNGEWNGHVRTVVWPKGPITFYFVRFDQPSDDGSGDGLYWAAEIEVDCVFRT